ncbi:16162_t:CDS:2, partial [Entrophospora sp. SA101]
NVDLDENYLIGKKDWKEIGTILHNNKYNMPSNGRIPRDIYKHSAGYKAEEWSKWILHFSLPLIKGRIDESNYNEDGNQERLRIHLLTFHYLLHISKCIDDFGPCCGYWQYPIERLCGMLLPLTKSKKDPYKNLFNNITLLEQFNLIKFFPQYSTIFEESVEENRGWPSHRVYVNNNYEGYEFYSPSVKHSLNNSEANKLKECYGAIYNLNNQYIKINMTIDLNARRKNAPQDLKE